MTHQIQDKMTQLKKITKFKKKMTGLKKKRQK